MAWHHNTAGNAKINMATLLDIGLLESFSAIFVWLFTFVLVYGIMKVTQVFKNDGLHALAAVAVAMFIAMSPDFTKLITLMIPWFVILALVITFVLMAGKFAGFKDNFIMLTLGGESSAWWIIIVAFIIILYATGGVFGQGLLGVTQGASSTVLNGSGEGGPTTSTSSFSTNVAATLFHPKILGMLLLLLISVFAVSLLSGKG